MKDATGLTCWLDTIHFNVIDRGTRWGAPDTTLSRSHHHHSINEVLEAGYN
jgi:hypothetical protein